jgi:hypothetical protein
MARLRMSVSRSGLELTEVRCSFRPGAQGTQSCNYGRRRGLLRANGEDVARILIREGFAHPYCVRQPWVSETKSMVPLKPTRAPRIETLAGLPEGRRFSAVRSRSRGEGAADQKRGRGKLQSSRWPPIRGPIGWSGPHPRPRLGCGRRVHDSPDPPHRPDAPQFFSTTCYVRPASLVIAMSVRR